MIHFWSQIARDLSPYTPGEQPRIANLVKLTTNESPYGASPLAEEAMRAAASGSLRLYPDPEALELAASDILKGRQLGNGAAACVEERRMFTRRRAVLAGVSLGLFGLAGPTHAQEPRVQDSLPKADAVIGRRSSGFYVRFNRPVDHEDSRLAIKQDGRTIEFLHPRLESTPDVLFARAPTLRPGHYSLHWLVGGEPQFDGEIPFTVAND